jgi:8-oxo-dGTP diphosphatase
LAAHLNVSEHVPKFEQKCFIAAWIPGSDAPVFGKAPPGVVCYQRRAAYAVIVKPNGAVAAVRAALQDGTIRYWLPGGGIEDNESPEETVVREVREELGRTLSTLGKIGEAVQFFYAATEERWYEMRSIFIRARFEDERAGAGEYELHWLDAKQYADSFFHECHAWAARMHASLIHSHET